VVDYSVVKHAIFATLYRPHLLGRQLVQALAGLERGIAEPIWHLSRKEVNSEDFFGCGCPPGVPLVPFAEGNEITISIACSDGQNVTKGVEELKDFYDEMSKSSVFAPEWYIHAACAGWKVRAKERFSGSFTAKTSFPILLIGNTLDPVTPLWNAHKMAKGFKDSVVLTQNSPGHCSSSATSLCTSKAVRAYFRNGTMPDPGTVCEVESSIFGESVPSDFASLGEEDIELLNASKQLQMDYFIPVLTQVL